MKIPVKTRISSGLVLLCLGLPGCSSTPTSDASAKIEAARQDPAVDLGSEIVLENDPAENFCLTVDSQDVAHVILKDIKGRTDYLRVQRNGTTERETMGPLGESNGAIWGLTCDANGGVLALRENELWRRPPGPGQAWTKIAAPACGRLLVTNDGVIALAGISGKEAGSSRRFNLIAAGLWGVGIFTPWWDRPGKLAVYRLEGDAWRLLAVVDTNDSSELEGVSAAEFDQAGTLQIIFTQLSRTLLDQQMAIHRVHFHLPKELHDGDQPVRLESTDLLAEYPQRWSSGEPIGTMSGLFMVVPKMHFRAAAVEPITGETAAVFAELATGVSMCALEQKPGEAATLTPLVTGSTVWSNHGPAFFCLPGGGRLDLVIAADHVEFKNGDKTGIWMMERKSAGLWSAPLKMNQTTEHTFFFQVAANEHGSRFVLWLDKDRHSRGRWVTDSKPPPASL